MTPLGPANSSTFVYVGQGFRTGPNPAGYWLTAVKLQIEDGTHTSYPNLSVPVSLWVSRLGRLEETAGSGAAGMLCTLGRVLPPAHVINSCCRCQPSPPLLHAKPAKHDAIPAQHRQHTLLLFSRPPTLQSYNATSKKPGDQVPGSTQYIAVDVPASLSLVTFALDDPYVLTPGTNYTVAIGMPSDRSLVLALGVGAGTPALAPGFANLGFAGGKLKQLCGTICLQGMLFVVLDPPLQTSAALICKMPWATQPPPNSPPNRLPAGVATPGQPGSLAGWQVVAQAVLISQLEGFPVT